MLKTALDWRAQMLLFAVVVTACVVQVMAGHYTQPYVASDSGGYLAFSDTRAHGYPLYLKAHSYVVGSLRYLPQVHGFLYLTSVAALLAVVSLKLQGGLLATVAFLACTYFSPGAEFYGVMSDPFYAAALTFGVALFLLHLYRRWLIPLGMSSLAFGIAASTRTIGMVPLVLFGLTALFCILRSSRPRWPSLLAATLVPALLALGVAAASNYRANGEFRIGSWGGVSLLGKGLLLAQPLPEEHPLAELNWIAEQTDPAREVVFEADDPWMRMLLTRQYYEYLRWYLMWDQFATRWPAWYETEGFEQGKVAGSLARAYVSMDPAGYASLVATDYAALWLVPRYFTESEREWLVERKEALGRIPYLTAFEATPDGQNDYFQIVPAAKPSLQVWVVRFMSLTFLAASVGWSISLLMSRHRLTLLAENVDLVFIVLLVHATYAATALVEAGLERYLLPTWPALTAGLLLLTHKVLVRQARPSSRSRTGLEA